MKKLTVTGFVLVMLAAAAILPATVFANGVAENVGPWGQSQNAKSVTLTGTFKLDNGFPTLVADGKTYDLMVPGFYRYQNVVKDGSTVTVTGFTFLPGPRANQNDSDIHLRVETVKYDGKEYTLADFDPRGGMYGPWSNGRRGPGMMASRGPWTHGPAGSNQNYYGRRW